MYHTSPKVQRWRSLCNLVVLQCVSARYFGKSSSPPPASLALLWTAITRYGLLLIVEIQIGLSVTTLTSKLVYDETLLSISKWKIAVDDKLRGHLRPLEEKPKNWLTEHLLKIWAHGSVVRSFGQMACISGCEDDSIIFGVKSDNINFAFRNVRHMAHFVLVMEIPICVYFRITSFI